MFGKIRRRIDLAYVVSPGSIDLIAQRLEDLPAGELTGVTLLLQGETHWLFLTCSGQKTAQHVRMRMREFYDDQAKEAPNKRLEEVLAEGFDRIIPGNAFPVWRECGWEGGMTAEEAFKKANELVEDEDG